MENCIFCKIVKKEIPCAKVYENENFLVFFDIKPVSDGHLILIPKKHVIWMQDADDQIIAEIFKLAKKLMLVLKTKLPCDYAQVSVVGNEVPHFHIHIIPRYKDDFFRNFPTKEYYSKEKESELIKKITSAIP